MSKSELTNLILASAIVYCCQKPAVSQATDHPLAPDASARRNTANEGVNVPGLRICWQERGAHGLLNRLVEFPNASAAKVAEVAHRMNVVSVRSAATIWMESPGSDVLTALATVSSLESLTIVGSKIRGNSLKKLSRFRTLRSLSLEGCRIDDVVCEQLSDLRMLESLCLTGGRVTDAGLAHLSTLPELTEVDLRGTLVSDAGLTRLQQCKALILLDVRGTFVTSAGAIRLRKKLPRLQVYHDRWAFPNLRLASRPVPLAKTQTTVNR